ncbi:hypothetical protein CLOP_g8922, partial [Closterium sp. NIES-67]
LKEEVRSARAACHGSQRPGPPPLPVEGGSPALPEQERVGAAQNGGRSLGEVEEEAREQLGSSDLLILLNWGSPGVAEGQLAVDFSARFNRKPHPNSALERMMHAEWQRRRARQPSLYNGSKFRYGGFSLQPPSAETLPSAAAAPDAPEGALQGRPRVCLHLGLTDYKSLITTNLCSDWRSFLAAPLSGSDPSKRLKTDEGGGREAAGGGRGEVDGGMGRADGGAGGGSSSTDASGVDASGVDDGGAKADAQQCTQAEPCGHSAPCATCQQAIGQRDAHACQYMGDALGNAALVVTADRRFLLLQRGTAVGEFPNCPVFPGGHPEPSEAGISAPPPAPPAHSPPAGPLSLHDASSTSPQAPPSPSDSSSPSSAQLNATIAREMFEGMKREVEEETGTPADSLRGMLFLGLCRRRENVRSLAMFLCHSSLTSAEVLLRYASAEHKFESTGLRAVPLVGQASLLAEARSMPGCHMGGAVLAYCHLALHGYIPAST